MDGGLRKLAEAARASLAEEERTYFVSVRGNRYGTHVRVMGSLGSDWELLAIHKFNEVLKIHTWNRENYVVTRMPGDQVFPDSPPGRTPRPG